MTRIAFMLILLVFTKYTEQKSTPEDDSYVAAVVEFEVSTDMDANLHNYVQHIQEAALQGADVVVFPEMTLTRGTRSIPVPIHGLLMDHPVPALEPELYDEMLVALSNASRQHEIYVVVNVQEILDCTDAPGEYCPEEKTYLFNTNVVFDRNGTVIDRFRKINLFGEFTRTPALQPDLGIFTTDFGVTFGHFICFDLMFQVPSVQVVQKHGLTDVIFTTMWFSEMPYLSATQIQESYAYSMNVNFIASGANNVRVGSAGSGIYSGKAGALISIMPGVPTTRLLVARVPKVPGQVTETYPGPIYDDPKEHDGLTLISDPSLPSHVSRLLLQGYQEFTLVDKDVSCRFRIRMNYRDGETVPYYRAFIQDGSNTYSRREVGVAACAVVACRDDDVKMCPFRYNKSESNAEITELEIEMTTYRNNYNKTLQCKNVVYYPESFTIHKFPLDRKKVTYIEHNTMLENEIEEKYRKRMSYSINVPQNELISFGIWGRIYIRDVDHSKDITEKDIQGYIELENNIFGLSNEVAREINYRYRAAAFSGVRSFSGLGTGGARVCSVFACSGDSIDNCTRRYPEYVENTTAIFEELSIVGTVPTPVIDPAVDANDSAFFPVSLRVSIMPLEPQEFSYTEEEQGNVTVNTMTLNNNEAEIYSFGIWGRVFAPDGEEASPPVPADDGADVAVDVEADVSPGVPGSSAIHLLNSFLLTSVVLILFK